MKVLVDAQLPRALSIWLRNNDVDALHVADLGLAAGSDHDIWNAALAYKAVLISKDRDFAEWAVARRPSPQLVWLRVGNRDTAGLLAWFETAWPRIVGSLSAGSAIVEVGR
ncbi:MAG TPA: DUF5615 family PIN-like protein [Caulobacter sp.]|nr:DUF5615 family PIN-like protein [Caulobacter sp.]